MTVQPPVRVTWHKYAGYGTYYIIRSMEKKVAYGLYGYYFNIYIYNTILYFV